MPRHHCECLEIADRERKEKQEGNQLVVYRDYRFDRHRCSLCDTQQMKLVVPSDENNAKNKLFS
jgi:hypothetical protein